MTQHTRAWRAHSVVLDCCSSFEIVLGPLDPVDPETGEGMEPISTACGRVIATGRVKRRSDAKLQADNAAVLKKHADACEAFQAALARDASKSTTTPETP